MLRTIRCILKIEISDLHRHLRALQHNLLLCTCSLYSWIPSSFLDNFFKKQWLFFRSFFNKEDLRITNKLHWLSSKYNVPIRSLSPVNYYCTIPPLPSIDKYKSKLRSHDHSSPSSLPPPQFFLSPIPHPSSHSSFNIQLNFNQSSPVDNHSFLISLNNKWFVNLSSIYIPHDVQCLLQLGGRFSLPPYKNSRHATFDFIKNIESNLSKFDPL